MATTTCSTIADQPLAVTVVNFPDVLENSRLALETFRDLHAESKTALNALRDRLGEQVYQTVVDFLENEQAQVQDAWEDVLVAEIVRHAPMLGPVIWALREHVADEHRTQLGMCCTTLD